MYGGARGDENRKNYKQPYQKRAGRSSSVDREPLGNVEVSRSLRWEHHGNIHSAPSVNNMCFPYAFLRYLGLIANGTPW